VLWLMAKFIEAKFYSVNVRANLILLVSYHGLLKEGLQVGKELVTHRSLTVLDQPTTKLYYVIIKQEFFQHVLEEWPKFLKHRYKRIHLVLRCPLL